MKKKKTFFGAAFPSGLAILSLLLLCFTILSCAQDSIFFDLSNEPEPRDPIIPGSPTNIIVVGNQIYVASRMGRTIHSFGANGWDTIPQPGGSIGDLATDGNSLFALVFPNGDPRHTSRIKRFDHSSARWDDGISMRDYHIQSIFGAGGRIFAGAQHRSNYRVFAILYYNFGESALIEALPGTFLLSGAASDAAGNIFLSTAGGGIFRFTNGEINSTPEAGTFGVTITGIIETGGVITAVSNDGRVFTNTFGNFTSFSAGVNFTGAMSIWKNFDSSRGWQPSLLLLGIRGRGASLTHGYRELVLSNGRPTPVVRVPGSQPPPSSVANQPRYAASIGIHPVTSILQVPNEVIPFQGAGWEPIIFASTSISGLWSLRDGQWNAED